MSRQTASTLIYVLLFTAAFWAGVAAYHLIIPDNIPEPKQGVGFYCEQSSFHWVNDPQKMYEFKHRVKQGECELIGFVGEEENKEKTNKKQEVSNDTATE